MNERPLILAIVGGFSSGKSALINAILRENVAPMGVTPVTAVAHKFTWAAKPTATFVLNDGQTSQRPLADLQSLTGNAAEAAKVREVRIGLPNNLLRDVEIWDTPGFGSNSLAHELAARKALTDGDVVLWVTPIDQALNRSESEKLGKLKASKIPVVLVVNKADLADDAAERDEAVADIAAEAGDLVRFVAWTSAKRALSAGEDAAIRGASGLPPLETRLADILLECRTKLREKQAAAAALPVVRANDVVCPDCAAVGMFDDKFCVCGRSLGDQHRACPQCSADNVVSRPRCRGCNVDFSAWERGSAYAAQAEEEVQHGQLVQAEASLLMALDSVPAHEEWTQRHQQLQRTQVHVDNLAKAAARTPNFSNATAEWSRAITTLERIGVQTRSASKLVGQHGLQQAARKKDPEEAVKALEWWADRGIVDVDALLCRRKERDAAIAKTETERFAIQTAARKEAAAADRVRAAQELKAAAEQELAQLEIAKRRFFETVEQYKGWVGIDTNSAAPTTITSAAFNAATEKLTEQATTQQLAILQSAERSLASGSLDKAAATLRFGLNATNNVNELAVRLAQIDDLQQVLLALDDVPNEGIRQAWDTALWKCKQIGMKHADASELVGRFAVAWIEKHPWGDRLAFLVLWKQDGSNPPSIAAAMARYDFELNLRGWTIVALLLVTILIFAPLIIVCSSLP